MMVGGWESPKSPSDSQVSEAQIQIWTDVVSGTPLNQGPVIDESDCYINESVFSKANGVGHNQIDDVSISFLSRCFPHPIALHNMVQTRGLGEHQRPT